MEMGRLLMRHWARGRTPSSFLSFLPELSDRRLIVTNVMAGIFKTVDKCHLLSPALWKPGMSCAHSSVTTREFSSDGVERKRKKLMPLQRGTTGGQGSSKKKVGSRGKAKIVQVPVGTVIHIVRGSIPSLEHVLPSQEEPTWEEWEGVPSHEGNNLSHDKSQCVKAAWSTDSENPGMKCLYPPDLSRKCGQNPSIRSLQDSRLLVQCHVPDEQGFLEASGHSSVSQLPRSTSDEDSNMSSESSGEYGLDGISDEEDEDDSVKQDIRSSVAEFVTVGQSLIVARGGVGGKGNAAMARGRGSDKSLPSFQHEPGRPGSEADLILELKTIADVGLVGAPNAGKSTLLGSLSNAKAISGHYKFTTLRPNIGMVEFEDFFSLTVADIPGLIEGAHKNRGLGHAFLRHIERTKVLAYVLDLAGGIGDDTGPPPWDQFEELVFELEQYQKGLSQRPSILIANKIDEEGVLAALEVLRQKVPFLEIYGVCAVLDEGVEELKVALRRLVESSQTNCPSLRLSDSVV